MRTLHFGLHVADLDRALAFYTALSYEVVGSVPETGIGHLTMLKLPDDDFVSIELVHDPGRGDVAGGTGRDQPPVGRDVPDPSRRLFLARSLAVTAGAVALGTAGTGMYFANAAPVVQRVPITLRGLDPALDGFRIVTFSDGHLSRTYGGRRFERLVRARQRPAARRRRRRRRPDGR